MSGLDIFAVIVILLLVLIAIALAVFVGALPGRIAHNRGHPFAEAVTVAGWIALIFVPLWPLALIWAYVDLPRKPQSSSDLEDVRRRLSAVEGRLQMREAAE
jgi:uncharacterized BrkB/YihY/UPF0761 family membrane protein